MGKNTRHDGSRLHALNALAVFLSGRGGAHGAGVVGVQAVEVLGRAGDGLPQRRHQLRLLDVFGLQGLGLVFPEQQRGQSGLPAQRLSPHHLTTQGRPFHFLIIQL